MSAQKDYIRDPECGLRILRDLVTDAPAVTAKSASRPSGATSARLRVVCRDFGDLAE